MSDDPRVSDGLDANPSDGKAPAMPRLSVPAELVDEPLCRCGHAEADHWLKSARHCLNARCYCKGYGPAFAPPPVPVTDNLDAKLSGRPSATSDGLSDEAEAIAKAAAAIRESDGSYATEIAGVRMEKCDEYGATETTRQRDALARELEMTREELAGFRAARLAGKDEQP